MAGSLIKIDEEIVSSAVASVTLGGTNWDSSYDVYQLVITNMEMSLDNAQIRLKFLASGTPQSTSNYDEANKNLIVNTTFGNFSLTNYQAFVLTTAGASTGTNARFNSNHFLFNMNNASEYSFETREVAYIRQGGTTLEGKQGGGVYTVAEAHNGVEITAFGGNVTAGTFSLYGLKK
tara:strand:+ start:142 stop:672 length:531 start_codon:yes stop_codon:yes gene_type:complete